MKQVMVNYKIMASQVTRDLDKQFSEGKIKNTEFADVYNSLMAKVLSMAFESPISDGKLSQLESQICLTQAQCDDQKYVTQFIRPLEQQKMVSETQNIEARTELTNAQATDQVYVTTYIRPEELLIKKEEVKIEKVKLDIAEQELLIKQQMLEIEKEKLELAKADVAYKEAQTLLTIRQTAGFDDNKAQKLFDAQMNSWAMMFSSGLLTTVPTIISGDQASKLYCHLSGQLGLPCS